MTMMTMMTMMEEVSKNCMDDVYRHEYHW